MTSDPTISCCCGTSMSRQIARAAQLHREASTANEQGNINRAEVLYTESRELFLREGGEYFVEASNIMNAVALMKEKHGDHFGALQAAEKSIHILNHLGASASRKADEIRLQSWIIMGNIHCRMAQYEEAEQVLQRALDHAWNAFGVADEQTTSIFHQLEVLYKQMGKLETVERF
jgi:tetratricopeptide (TPR) repeat protein